MERAKVSRTDEGPLPGWGPVWRRVLLGIVEILIPVLFIVGFVYWQAPWLFWAVVRFFRGEPIIGF